MRNNRQFQVLCCAVLVGVALLCTGAAFAGGVASSTFGSGSFSAGIPLDVTILVTPDNDTLAYTVEDRPPAGWTVSQIGGGGVFAGGVVRWGPFFDASQRTVNYKATPPAGATGTVTFVGSASFNGSSVAVGGARSLSAGGGGNTGNCVAASDTLCLSGNRFSVKIDWLTRTGDQGVGTKVPITDDSGLFWFFEPSNLEVLIKVLDVCSFAPDFWVFFAATTDVNFTLRVTDTETGAVRQYTNPQGVLAQSIGDTSAFPCS